MARPMTEGEKSIVYNLRYKYKEEIANVPDTTLLKVYDEWNSTDKTDDYLVWLNDVHCYGCNLLIKDCTCPGSRQ